MFDDINHTTKKTCYKNFVIFQKIAFPEEIQSDYQNVKGLKRWIDGFWSNLKIKYQIDVGATIYTFCPILALR